MLSDDSWHLHAYYWHRQVPPMKPSAAENPGRRGRQSSLHEALQIIVSACNNHMWMLLCAGGLGNK